MHDRTGAADIGAAGVTGMQRRQTRNDVEQNAQHDRERDLVTGRGCRAPQLIEPHAENELGRDEEIPFVHEGIVRMDEIRVAHTPRCARLCQEGGPHFGLPRERMLDLGKLDDTRARVRPAHTCRHHGNESFVLELQKELVAPYAR